MIKKKKVFIKRKKQKKINLIERGRKKFRTKRKKWPKLLNVCSIVAIILLDQDFLYEKKEQGILILYW
jgi:hypothetical protein